MTIVELDLFFLVYKSRSNLDPLFLFLFFGVLFEHYLYYSKLKRGHNYVFWSLAKLKLDLDFMAIYVYDLRAITPNTQVGYGWLGKKKKISCAEQQISFLM